MHNHKEHFHKMIFTLVSVFIWYTNILPEYELLIYSKTSGNWPSIIQPNLVSTSESQYSEKHVVLSVADKLITENI